MSLSGSMLLCITECGQSLTEPLPSYEVQGHPSAKYGNNFYIKVTKHL